MQDAWKDSRIDATIITPLLRSTKKGENFLTDLLKREEKLRNRIVVDTAELQTQEEVRRVLAPYINSRPGITLGKACQLYKARRVLAPRCAQPGASGRCRAGRTPPWGRPWRERAANDADGRPPASAWLPCAYGLCKQNISIVLSYIYRYCPATLSSRWIDWSIRLATALRSRATARATSAGSHALAQGSRRRPKKTRQILR